MSHIGNEYWLEAQLNDVEALCEEGDFAAAWVIVRGVRDFGFEDDALKLERIIRAAVALSR
jgi:hypothetical protein